MILDTLGNMKTYIRIHAGFQTAINFLEMTDLSSFTSGRRDIVADRLYAVAAAAPGVGVHDARLEAHRKYIDIQYAVSGIDNIGWRPTAKCANIENEYNSEKDVIFFKEVPETWFGLVPGDCAIFFPGDAHAPLAVNGILHKIVLKVAIDW